MRVLRRPGILTSRPDRTSALTVQVETPSSAATSFAVIAGSRAGSPMLAHGIGELQENVGVAGLV